MLNSKIVRPPPPPKGGYNRDRTPGWSVTPGHLPPCKEFWENLGYEVKFGRSLFSSMGRFSGTLNERATDLQEMMEDKEVKAIICARGGHGSLNLLDHLKPNKMCPEGKWLIGFSDATCLLNFFFKEGFESIHGLMGIQFSALHSDRRSRQLLLDLLTKKENISYDWEPGGEDLVRPGKGAGRLIGGNLRTFSLLTGTQYDLETKGCILFLEEVDEYLHTLDQYMLQLYASKKLHSLSGLIIGGLTKLSDTDPGFGKTAPEIIAGSVREFDYPVAFRFPAGHEKRNWSLPIGREVELQVSHSKANLKFENG